MGFTLVSHRVVTPFGISSGADIKSNPSLVGLRVATTRTVPGYDFTSQAAVGAFGANLTGTGTALDPYLIDRVRFTDLATVGGADLTGKHFAFTNCRAYGQPGNPTPGGSYFIGTTSANPPASLSIDSSELGPNATLAPDGGPASGGGCDKGVQAFCPLTVTRSNIWGANILAYLQTGPTDGPSLLDSLWLHDVWSATNDHTDLVNGNQHASHVTVARSFLDGIRTGGAYVVNGIGIYDDPQDDPTIVVTDWTLDSIYVDRTQTTILSSTNTSRFQGPFVVRNSIFDRFSVDRFSCRTPSGQSGNRDGAGTPLTIP